MGKKGFTLIELMIVVAIVSMLGSFGVSMIKKSIVKTDGRKIKEQIPIYIENLIERAFEEGKTYQINIVGNELRISHLVPVIKDDGTKNLEFQELDSGHLKISSHYTISGDSVEINEKGGKVDAEISTITVQLEGVKYFKVEVENLSTAMEYAFVRRYVYEAGAWREVER